MVDVERRYKAQGRWRDWTHGSEVTTTLVEEILIGMYCNKAYNSRVCHDRVYTNQWYTPRNAVEGFVNQIGRYVDAYVQGHGRSLLDSAFMNKWLRDNDGPIGASAVFLRVLTKGSF